MTTQSRPAGLRSPAGRTPFVAGIASLLLVTSAFVVLSQAHRATQAIPRTTSAAARPQGIEGLQQRLRDVPRDWSAWASLGSAYVQEARISGDPSYYPKAEEALRTSLRLEGTRNFQAMTGMGALAAARHDFAAALAWGERARAIDEYSAAVYGVIGDALVELGRYPEAFSAFQRMVDLRPGLSSYARVSYAWELQGNVPNAIKALELALQAATTPADAAFAAYYIGELHWNSGRVDDASAAYRLALAHDPGFVPAHQGLGKIAAAHGDIVTAIREYEDVVARLPIPQNVIELGDLYRLTGNAGMAARQDALLHAQERLFRANGVNIDLEQALFDADHGTDLHAGLAAARSEWQRRKSIFVADALAWTLYANGMYSEALGYSEQAMKTGTRNALFLFHKAMIERALGSRVAARRDLLGATAINPHFSFLWAGRVPSILATLR